MQQNQFPLKRLIPVIQNKFKHATGIMEAIYA